MYNAILFKKNFSTGFNLMQKRAYIRSLWTRN